MTRLDGNVLAGPLGEIYAVDVTTALARCAACGDVAALACALVYGAPMGYVARCRSCDGVLLVLVQRPDGNLLDTRGVASLQAAR